MIKSIWLNLHRKQRLDFIYETPTLPLHPVEKRKDI